MDLFKHEKLNRYKTKESGYVAMRDRIRINAVIAEFYKRLGSEYEDVLITRGSDTKSMYYTMDRRATRILSCGRFIDTLRFKDVGVHKVNRIKLCCDKFCGNCQKQLANARERKYTPLLKELEKYFDMYHITLTVPNVSEMFLPKAVDDIIHAFSEKLIRYVSGRKKIKGVNFGGFGYKGAIRSLEITQNVKTKTYHPHLHCIFVFRKGLNLDEPKIFKNSFSFSYGREVSKFSAFEIFIQKLWKACYDGERVTKSTIEASSGYSCEVNRADGNYHQIFKYAIKGLLDEKRGNIRKNKGSIESGLTYEEFHALYFALENRRAMQGYGCFQGLKMDESVLDDPDASEAEISEIVNELRKVSSEEYVSEKLDSVIENIVKKHEIYFSAKNLRDNLESLKSEE